MVLSSLAYSKIGQNKINFSFSWCLYWHWNRNVEFGGWVFNENERLMRSSNRLSIFGSERQTKWICWAQFKSIIDSWCAVKPVAPLNREFLKRKEIGENTDMTMLRLCPLVLLRQLHQRTTKTVPRLVLCDWMRLSRLRAQKPECGRGGPSCPSQSLATRNTLWKRRPAVGPYFGCCGNERTETDFFKRWHPPLAIPTMSTVVRSALGISGAVMLLHSGYSAFESLTYEKSFDPSSRLELPLDVSSLKFWHTHKSWRSR